MNSFFTLDTILQGFVLVFFTVLGGLVFFTDHLEKKSFSKRIKKKEEGESESNQEDGNFGEADGESIKSLNEDLGKTFAQALQLIIGLKNLTNFDSKIAQASSSIMYVLILAVAIFAMGIFAKSSADHWMNKGNLDHLGNKYIWADSNEMINTSSNIRLTSFNRIYKQELGLNYVKDSISENNKNRHYYFTKHKILHEVMIEGKNSQSYKADLEKTISIIEYSQVFALSFFILYVFAWLNLISIQIRSFTDKKNKDQLKANNSKLFKIIKLIYRLLITTCIGIILSGVLIHFNFINLSQVDLRKYYFIAVNGIPIITWCYLWYRAKQKDNSAHLESNPDITYQDLFFKHYYTIIFLFVGLIGYLTASVTWHKSEVNKHHKIYGFYKNIDPKMKDRHENEINRMFKLSSTINIKQDSIKR